MTFKNLTTIIILIMSCSWGYPLFGANSKRLNEAQPVLYYANSQTYDRELGILILKGDVEFEHQGNVLEADYVTYNEKMDIVTASGNVRLRQPNGDINFAEYVELTGDMKEGIILQMRTLLEDNSKVAAREGRKFEDREELDQVVYTPCQICDNKPPTWQMNARHATKDNANKNIYFTDSQIRFLDIPVMYFPYIYQPLERRSGFLIPRPGYNSDFGANIQVPYYIVLSEDKDITLYPTFFTKQYPLLLGEYRQAFGNGFFKTDGSITQYKLTPKDKKAEKRDSFTIPKTRGHFYIDSRVNITDVWRGSFSGGKVSDKTYFRKYDFSGWKGESNLTSQGILEGFLNQYDYAAAEVYHFQGLRDSDRQKNIAGIFPFLRYNGYSDIDPLGGRFNFDGNVLNLTRREGINMQRGIGKVGWQRPWAIPFGQILTIFATTRGDLYQVENLKNQNFNNSKPNKKGGARFFPQAGLDWRWPFINTFQKQSVIIQPMGQLIIAPDKAVGLKAHYVPNEDSTDFAFNDANLFSPNRFPGYDLIDTGSRVVYGGQVLMAGARWGDMEAFFGQSYSLSKPNRKDKLQGLDRHASDYVGRIEMSPLNWLSLNYRFRLNQRSFSQRIAEFGGTLGPELAKLGTQYLFISKYAGTPDNKDFKQINLTLSSQITKYWALLGNLRHDLRKKKDGGGRLEHGIGALYRDDCFGLGITLKRQYYRDRDLRPGTTFMVTLFLKNIGDFSYSFSPNQGMLGERRN